MTNETNELVNELMNKDFKRFGGTNFMQRTLNVFWISGENMSPCFQL
jgi:hypothetical protein